MPPAEIFIVAIPFLAVVSLGVISTVRTERRRRRSVKGTREFAERHSWRYQEDAPGLTERYELPISASGRLRHCRSRHLISGTYRGREARVWEFSATEKTRRRRSGGGRHPSSTLYHLIALTMDQELPSLTMTSRGGAISRALAGQPSQTTGDPDFDNAWWAKAHDQGVLRSLLSSGLRAHLMASRGEVNGLATRGRTLVVWRKGRQQAEKLEPMLEKAAEISRYVER
ncbi:hypothetical protein [Bogoriella caseilytica]|uniref:Uncharacterized protein n=1 Tax=Bogoriella caseilytica TaxID=56055 RepID=A0A3N2BBP1_9MICO|nr:hypothetical protein [Bogoriella caseilytica]ROR72676.1 hypothetical protein EDD31_1034 [Bogoriella caseilytica]